MDVYLSSIPDEQKSRSQKFVLDRNPRRKRMDEKLDVRSVVLVRDRPWHNRGLLIESGILDESYDSLSVSTRDQR